MNTLVIVLIAAVVLVAAYVFYGRWLANKWGIDPLSNSRTAKTMYLQTDGLFSAISFHLSRAQALSPVPFRQQPSAGYPFCSGF